MATKILEKGRSARLDVRMPLQKRQMVERAADLDGVSLTQFAETALIQRAQAVIESHEKTLLSLRDQERFLALLDQDTEPIPALLNAIERYQKSGLSG